MTTADFAQLEKFFDAYVARFADATGVLLPMQQLKLEHSRHVAACARKIMQAEQWPDNDFLTGSACALLHDIGRFSQYAQFQTFEDKRSINHAQRGFEVLQAEGALKFLPSAERDIILAAVRLHNVRDLPSDLPLATARFAHLVRDADKLDIFRVFQEAIETGQLDEHPEIAWSLDRTPGVSPELMACVREGRSVSYGQIRSLADFVMIQVCWLRSQMHYDAALALAMQRGALDFREKFVCSLDPSAATRECFSDIRASIGQRLTAAKPGKT